MSSAYEGKDPLELAKQAEKDLNSREAKTGHGTSDTTQESGIDASVVNKFPPGAATADATAGAGRSDNAKIPPEEGGVVDAKGRVSKAKQFEGEVGEGPELKLHEDQVVDPSA